jgi:hypothetical protein
MTYRAELAATILSLSYPYTTLDSDALVSVSKPEDGRGGAKEEPSDSTKAPAIEAI